MRKAVESRGRGRGPGLRIAKVLAGAAVLASVVLAGCEGGEPVGPEPTPVAVVAVVPGTGALRVGDSLRLVAMVRSPEGDALPDRRIEWSSGSSAVAEVGADGLVVGRGPGTTEIVATSGGRRGSALVTVRARAVHDLVFEAFGSSAASSAWVLALDGGDPLPLPFTATAGLDPTPSPDGAWVAWVEWVESGNSEIFVARRDGSEARRLTWTMGPDDQPSWSPDGRRIVFRSYRLDREGQIWTMEADGGDPRLLTPDPGNAVIQNARPAWSPDGSTIAFASTMGGDWGLWAMTPEGGDLRQLTNTWDLDTEPAWSPDGRSLVFRRTEAAGSDLWIVAADGSAERPIRLPGEQRIPAWSPDGSLIAFVSQERVSSSRSEIWTVAPDGSGARALTPAGEGMRLNPAWMRRP